ncbi:MAG: 3-oxoacid CoA-transferase subunit B [Pseudomonadota bacterium]
MDKKEIRTIIAKRIARELKEGDVVNLGIGMPTLVANFVPRDVHIILHSENGILRMGPTPPKGGEDLELTNAGNAPVTILPGGMFFDSAFSFGIIRGGHLDVTVLGGLQVDSHGNLANWMIPGKKVPGMGGGMDLAFGAKRVIVAMEHTQNGKPKILKKCTLPLTAPKCVDLICTEMALIEVTPKGLLLKERNPSFTIEEIQSATEAKLIIPDHVGEMKS